MDGATVNGVARQYDLVAEAFVGLAAHGAGGQAGFAQY
jgi:hypothetical protein